MFLEHPFYKREIPDGLGWDKEIRYEPIVNLGDFLIDLNKDKTYISNFKYKIVLEPKSTTSFSFKYKLETSAYDEYKDYKGKEKYKWDLEQLNNYKLTVWFQSASFSKPIVETIIIE